MVETSRRNSTILTQLEAHGAQMLARGSQLEARGAQMVARGSRTRAHDCWGAHAQWWTNHTGLQNAVSLPCDISRKQTQEIRNMSSKINFQIKVKS